MSRHLAIESPPSVRDKGFSIFRTDERRLAYLPITRYPRRHPEHHLGCQIRRYELTLPLCSGPADHVQSR